MNCTGRKTCLLVLVLCSLATKSRAQLGAVGGVYIDPEGVVRDGLQPEQSDALDRLKADALSVTPTSQAVAERSTLRKISLKRLATELQKTEGALPAEVRYLGGLTSIRYVFWDAENADIVIAGPAESWKRADDGSVVGNTSGLPVLRLEDLRTALRYSFSSEPVPQEIGCSIDPTPAGMQRYAAAVRAIGVPNAARLGDVRQTLEQGMGPQAVRVFGVDADSRLAITLVAADYRLKRLAMGWDNVPLTGFMSYLERKLKSIRSPASARVQSRFWFEAGFDAVVTNEDRSAYELRGVGFRAVTAPRDSATKTPAKGSGKKSVEQQFVEELTRRLPDLLPLSPSFAELGNAIQFLAASELAYELLTRDGRVPAWMNDLTDTERHPLTKYNVPKSTPSLASVHRVRNRYWVYSVSGGVFARPQNLVSRDRRTVEQVPAALRAFTGRKAGLWWWD